MKNNKEKAMVLFGFQDKEVRTAKKDDGSIWFAAKDVAAVLDITWSGATLSNIPEEWVTMLKLNIVKKGEREVTIISEPAVYKLAFRSNKPEADKFTNFIVSEVLPQIRKTGKYIPKPPKKIRIPKVDWTKVAQEEMNKLQDPVLIDTHYRIICEFCHKIKPECYEFKSISIFRPHYLCPKCVVQKATNKKAGIVQPLEAALSFLNVDFLLRDVKRKVRSDEYWAKLERKANKIQQQRMITEG